MNKAILIIRHIDDGPVWFVVGCDEKNGSKSGKNPVKKKAVSKCERNLLYKIKKKMLLLC